MCPLRLILIFLSATLAGFFVLRNLKSEQPHLVVHTDTDENDAVKDPNASKVSPFSRVFVKFLSFTFNQLIS
jgi:hypothetical protein